MQDPSFHSGWQIRTFSVPSCYLDFFHLLTLLSNYINIKYNYIITMKEFTTPEFQFNYCVSHTLRGWGFMRIKVVPRVSSRPLDEKKPYFYDLTQRTIVSWCRSNAMRTKFARPTGVNKFVFRNCGISL